MFDQAWFLCRGLCLASVALKVGKGWPYIDGRRPACLLLTTSLTRRPLQEAAAQGLATGAASPAGGRGSEDGEGDLPDSELHRLRVVHHLRCAPRCWFERAATSA